MSSVTTRPVTGPGATGGQAVEPGSIGFYRTSGSLIDRAITLRTGSVVVHVSIFDTPTTTIAATSAGITRQGAGGEYRIWSPGRDAPYTQARLDEAYHWLHGELGKPYGVADIANQILLLANKEPVLLDKSNDCSSLATRFLWIAGYPLPGPFIVPESVTPGGLFLALFGYPAV